MQANIGWCGRGDGGMIFNTNDLEVAPPHSPALYVKNDKEVYVQARSKSIFDVFDSKRRYLVPLFQRQYVWSREAQWEP